jgi:hypothetical protein
MVPAHLRRIVPIVSVRPAPGKRAFPFAEALAELPFSSAAASQRPDVHQHSGPIWPDGPFQSAATAFLGELARVSPFRQCPARHNQPATGRAATSDQRPARIPTSDRHPARIPTPDPQRTRLTPSERPPVRIATSDPAGRRAAESDQDGHRVRRRPWRDGRWSGGKGVGPDPGRPPAWRHQNAVTQMWA